MSIESAIQRVAAINAARSDVVLAAEGHLGAITGGTPAPGAAEGGGTLEAGGTPIPAGSFAAVLRQAGLAPGSNGASAPGLAAQALGGYSPSAVGTLPGVYSAGAGAGIGARIVAIAESQAGRAEEPLGSNEGAAVAMYRSATRGAIPGAPWCAYFASWAARQAGEPLGSEGQGLGSVAEIWSWAQSTGRAIPNGPGVVPKPGDLIVFGDEHVGIVRGVLPNGKIATVEGNYENKVALNERSPGEPTGYVEMG